MRKISQALLVLSPMFLAGCATICPDKEKPAVQTVCPVFPSYTAEAVDQLDKYLPSDATAAWNWLGKVEALRQTLDKCNEEKTSEHEIRWAVYSAS